MKKLFDSGERGRAEESKTPAQLYRGRPSFSSASFLPTRNRKSTLANSLQRVFYYCSVIHETKIMYLMPLLNESFGSQLWYSIRMLCGQAVFLVLKSSDISEIKHLISDFSIVDFRFSGIATCDFWFLNSGFRFLNSKFWFQVSECWFLNCYFQYRLIMAWKSNMSNV